MLNWMFEAMSDLRFRARALFQRDAMERELDDELRFHVEREAEKYVASGMPPNEAWRRARIAFGGMEQTKEESRHVRGIGWVERTMSDVRYAVRSLASRPLFSLAIIATLALGVGANAAMFGIVDRLLFRAPAYMRNADRVHRLYLLRDEDGLPQTDSHFAYARYLDVRRDTHAFDAVVATSFRDVAVGVGVDAREMPIAAVSASYWSLFDAAPVLGRVFSSIEDSLPLATPVAVLGYAYWQNHYGAARDVLGRELLIGTTHYTIIGVAPPGFAGIESKTPVAFIPISTYAANAGFVRDVSTLSTRYNWSWLQLFGRRKAGVDVAAADADLTNAFTRSYIAQRSYSPSLPAPELVRPRAQVGSLHVERGPRAGPVAAVATWVGGVTLVVLLIACANVANLLLARAMQRRREIALRLALGVTRSRLLTQLLTESFLLALVSGVAGVLAAQWGGAALQALFLRDIDVSHTTWDARTLLFASVAVLATGILTGLVPALQAGRDDVVTVLKAGVREGVYRRSKTRAALLLLQSALSVVLLAGAGLFVRSLGNVRALRLGYDVDSVLYVSTNLRGTKLTHEEEVSLARRVRDEAAALPGVASATRAVTIPFWSTETEGLYTAGIDSVNKRGHFTLQGGDARYLETMGTRLLSGRSIEEHDVAGSAPVMLVSAGMARRLWPNESAIGKCMQVGADTAPCSEIVGVVEDIHQTSFTDPDQFQYYLPVEQYRATTSDLFVRARGETGALSTLLRRRLQSVLPGSAYISVTPLRDIVDPNRASWQLGATMFSIFGLLSLILSAVGLYSVNAYDVTQRSHEIGVRIALGARATHVVRLVVGEGVRFAVLGLVIGGALALVAGKWVAPLLFNVSPRDPVVFGGVTGTLLAVALVACAIPAYRAARVDPNRTLRAE